MGSTSSRPPRRKDAAWPRRSPGIPASRITALRARCGDTHPRVSINWSCSADHGEQPFWALVTLACMLGQVGLTRRRLRGAMARSPDGSAFPKYSGPTLPQGTNAVSDFIPVARFTNMLLQARRTVPYNGRDLASRLRLVYWAGGNPFHHHPGPQRLMLAGASPNHRVHEQF